MADMKLIKVETLQEIADAIKLKEATADLIPVDEYAERIRAIEGGGENKLAQLTSDTLTEITAKDLDGVTKIRSYAFNSARNLVSVEIPSGVTSINTYTFQYCSNLVTVIIPEGVVSIDNYAFHGCTSLKTVTLPSSLTRSYTRIFSGCSALESVIVKATTPPRIESNAFENCKNLAEIIVPTGCGDTYKAATNWSTYASIIVEESGSASTQLPTPTIQMEMGELYINDFGAAESADFYWSADGNEPWQHLGNYGFAGMSDQECIYESTLYEWLEAIGRNNSDTVTYVHCITHATGYQDSLASNAVMVNGANT